MTTKSVLLEVEQERQYQDIEWGTDFYDANTPYDWAGFIGYYAYRHLRGDPSKVDLLNFRTDMVKVAALAVAAVESIDRKWPSLK